MGRSGLKRANGKAFKEESRSNRPNSSKSPSQKPKAQSKAQVKSHPRAELSTSESHLSLASQQLLLDVFEKVFEDVLRDERLSETLQEVKGALYDRDFERAFGSGKFLEAYAVRWSPVSVISVKDRWTLHPA